MLACFLRHRNSRLGSAFVVHPNEKRLRTTQENITQLARRMEVEMSLTHHQAYTKGAIYRQMQEYSRKASTYESRLEELHKRSVHHDDHLRLIDAWWRQVCPTFSSPHYLWYS